MSSIKWLSNSFSPYKSIRDQIWLCCKIGQGQPRVTIWTNYDEPESQMLHTKPQGHWPFGFGEEDFWRVFEGWPRPREQTFVSPSHWVSIWNLAVIGQAVLEKIFENGGRRTDDDGPWLYYKLTNEPKGSGELKLPRLGVWQPFFYIRHCHKHDSTAYWM